MGTITKVSALEILDSRGEPTLEVELRVNGYLGRAAVPSGASTGSHEALELRDGEKRFLGKGVQKALHNVLEQIAPQIVDQDFEQDSLDKFLINLDGTTNKSKLGANAVLAVSLAFAHGAAASSNLPLYNYIKQIFGTERVELPRPLFNVINGGRHANWAADIQEYQIAPLTGEYPTQLRMGAEIFHHLGKLLDQQGMSVNVGNEGGYAPRLESNAQAFELILQAIEQAGYRPGEDVAIGIDAAASEFFDPGTTPGSEDDTYILKVDQERKTTSQWQETLAQWLGKYPIISVEDPFAEDAWDSWQNFTAAHGAKIQVVGDDLLVTNTSRITDAIERKACNALLMKVNQVGTLSEALAALKIATNAGWKSIVSHRSGETEDVSIAHIAVGTNAGQIKAGAPSRGERTAKYNELLRIYNQLHG